MFEARKRLESRVPSLETSKKSVFPGLGLENKGKSGLEWVILLIFL